MAVSDRDLPPTVCTRAVCEDDLDAALALSREAGWNQVAADWRIFLDMGRVIGLVREGRLIATAAMLPFGPDFAWISMVLVTGSERRQGLARFLLRSCVETLCAEKRVPILDATPAGRLIYLGLGFRDCWTMHRLTARAIRAPARAARLSAATIRPLAAPDWPAVAACDRDVFAADRSALLRRLATRLPAAALVAEQDGRIVGCLFGRDGQNARQLGPLVATNEAVAMELFAHAFASVPGPLVVDLPDHNSALGAWLAGLGFERQRPLTRMAYGQSEAFGDASRLFAVAGPELG